MHNFKDKVVVITGAGSGIGRSLAVQFANLGCHLAIADNSMDTLQETEKLISNITPNHSIHHLDVSNRHEVQLFADEVIKNHNNIHILINNAGTNIDTLSLRMKNEEWKKVIDINLSSTFYLCKHAMKKMLKNKYGRIVNITSIVGHTGNLGQANYSASKAGMVAMSKSLAIEYAKKNITINCVSPGFIQSKMTDKIVESIKAVLTSRIPMSKLGTGEDVSNTVAFLSSDAASYITGETIHVNGGMYMA